MPVELSRILRSELEIFSMPSRLDADHFVQFYERDEFMVDSVAEFIGTGLAVNGVGIVIATAAHRTQLAARLAARGFDLAAAGRKRRLIELDAADTLARFMVDGWPDAQRFDEVIGAVVSQAAACGARVRAFGEMVALLVEQGNAPAAIQLEQLWNELGRQHAFSLFCAYPMAAFGAAEDADRLHAVCCAHAHVMPTESYVTLRRPAERFRAIAKLQQKAAALDREVARREAAEARLRDHEELLRRGDERERHRVGGAAPGAD